MVSETPYAMMPWISKGKIVDKSRNERDGALQRTSRIAGPGESPGPLRFNAVALGFQGAARR